MDIASFDEIVMFREQPIIGRPAKETNNALVVLVDKRCDWRFPMTSTRPSARKWTD
jgi:hypothetical protein